MYSGVCEMIWVQKCTVVHEAIWGDGWNFTCEAMFVYLKVMTNIVFACFIFLCQ